MRLIQSGTAFRYFKVGSVFLQSKTSITMWDNYSKVGFNKCLSKPITSSNTHPSKPISDSNVRSIEPISASSICPSKSSCGSNVHRSKPISVINLKANNLL